MAAHMIAPLATAANTAGNLLIDEGKFLYGVKGRVEELERQLHRIQRFLKDEDAAGKDGEDRIQTWALEHGEIAYEADDLLEGYAFKFGGGGPGGWLWLQGLYKYARVCKNLYPLHRFGSEIEALNSRFQSLTRSFEVYGNKTVKKGEGSSSAQHPLRRTYSFDDEEDFVGLESDVNLLVKHLVQADGFRVVSLSGMGGLGKTTLANKVYKHRDVNRYFDKIAPICVSQQWQTKDILQRILIKLDPENRKKIKKQWTDDELFGHLFRLQQETKCLIVLDDIWTTYAWDCIKVAFPSSQSISKILLTTRNIEVAKHIDPDGFHHEPRFLSKDESWKLLEKKILRQRNNGKKVVQQRDNDKGHVSAMSELTVSASELTALTKLGNEMVAHCCGLPLAVIVLGGILSTKNSLSEWKIVHHNIKSYLWKGKGFGKEEGELENILGMSYYDLPFELKPCFLYLGCFPEDTEIRALNIYQLWMAEGLVLQVQGNEESILELAELYLGELGLRGMVQLQTFDIPGMRKRFKSCRLHDLMRKMCLLKAEHGNFMSLVKYRSKGKGTTNSFDSLPASSISKVRRLVLTLDGEKGTSTYIYHDKKNMKCLRMLRYENPNKEVVTELPGPGFLDKFEMLRSLTVDVGWMRIPESVELLVHLRYLSTRGCGHHPKIILPSSLGNLKKLQTLDLYGSMLPPNAQNIFLKITGLVCLYLPEGGDSKIRLHGLNKLEVLENFNDKFQETKDLIKLPSLRVLSVKSCSELENLELIAKHAQSNNRLEYVKIRTYYDFSEKREKGLVVLKQLLFGSSVCRLSTYGRMWKFPAYEPNTFSNLLELCMECRDLNLVETIKTLEQFTCLRSLWILNAKGKKMCFHARGFPQLQNLYLHDCLELERWDVEEGAMCNLRKLTIMECPELETIPERLVQFLT